MVNAKFREKRPVLSGLRLRTKFPRMAPRFPRAPSRAEARTPSEPTQSALRRPASRAPMLHDGLPATCRQRHPRRDTPHSQLARCLRGFCVFGRALLCSVVPHATGAPRNWLIKSKLYFHGASYEPGGREFESLRARVHSGHSSIEWVWSAPKPEKVLISLVSGDQQLDGLSMCVTQPIWTDLLFNCSPALGA